MTFALSVVRDFGATHWMPSGKKEERTPHRHDYRLQATVEGRALGPEGFLVDIDVLKEALDRLVTRVDGSSVNALPELNGRPPSLENFAAALWSTFRMELEDERLESLTITLWESADASASYGQRLKL